MTTSSALPVPQPADLETALRRRVIGQPAALEQIIPSVQMYRAGLAPPGRPVGVFLLLGPTGTGKTKTVESLAEVLHGSSGCLLKIDCGEFQLEHEVAKLIGAPPGYLGHRETHPLITQQKLNATTSDECRLSIVLFDEVEKAALSLGRLLLGVLDRAILHLGDNTEVNFENSLVFLTSNLGASEMQRVIRPDFGYESALGCPSGGLSSRLQKTAINAVRKKFSPEFVNRIDAVVTFEPLSHEALSEILDQQISELQEHIAERLGGRAFLLEVPGESREHLLRLGSSPEYGARELKRTIHRHLMQPLAAMVAEDKIPPRARVCATLDRSGNQVRIRFEESRSVSRRAARPVVPLRVPA